VRLTGTTPAAPDDDGCADPALGAALASGDDAAVVTALFSARLLVPVVAVPAAEGEAEMAVPALVSAAGRALPAFSSYDEVRAWHPDARPVPMAGVRVLVAAKEEGYDGVVIDVAGAHPFAISGTVLDQLAAAARAVASSSAANVQVVR
jgi:hypothetical protein